MNIIELLNTIKEGQIAEAKDGANKNFVIMNDKRLCFLYPYVFSGKVKRKDAVIGSHVLASTFTNKVEFKILG